MKSSSATCIAAKHKSHTADVNEALLIPLLSWW